VPCTLADKRKVSALHIPAFQVAQPEQVISFGADPSFFSATPHKSPFARHCTDFIISSKGNGTSYVLKRLLIDTYKWRLDTSGFFAQEEYAIAIERGQQFSARSGQQSAVKETRV
jgi:hypothetical protein